MKKILTILSVGLPALMLSLMTAGCVEEVPEVIEDLRLSNVLTPTSTSATVSSQDGRSVTFTWANSNAATQYHLEIYGWSMLDENETIPALEDIDEDVLSGHLYREEDVAPSESGSSTSVTVTCDPELTLYARVSARNPEDASLGDSKWAAFPYPLETYTIMDPIAGLYLKARESQSITVTWELEDGDQAGINQFRISPSPDGKDEAFKRYDLTPEEIAAKEKVIDGLDPSVKYTIAAHNNSANRGEVYAWTTPDWEGVNDAADTSVLKQLLREAGNPDRLDAGQPLKVRLTKLPSEYVYDLDGVADVLGSVEITGQQSVNGVSPRVLGGFKISPARENYTWYDASGAQQSMPSTTGTDYIRLEALELDGDAYGTDRPLKLDQDSGAFPADRPVSVYIVNCDIHSYESGFFYASEVQATFDEIVVDNCTVSDIQGSGGDGFDIRQARTVNNIEITNNTFDGGMRDFIRIDDYEAGDFGGTTVTSFLFGHNTVNNIGQSGRRVFYVRADVPEYVVSDNLFMNIADAIFTHTNASYDPKTMSGNFFYNNSNAAFFEKVADGKEYNNEFTQEVATADGGAVLSSDPCYDSGRSIFNVVNTTVLEAGAGDPRWLVEYVAPEEADLVPVEYGYAWPLTDREVFYNESISATSRLGNIQFYVQGNPINVTDDGFLFTAAATTEYSGVPNDCALGFLVDGPGSVVISTIASGSANNHITVACGPADGSVAEVAGAVYADAARARVAFPDFEAGVQQMVYIYACGPIVLSELSWIEDTATAGSTPLDTPADLALDTDIADDQTGDVTLSWTGDDNAGSYLVSMYGPVARLADEVEDWTALTDAVTTTVTQASHTFSAAGLEAGVYFFSVQALTREGDLAHENSEVSEMSLETAHLIRTETLAPVSANGITTWGNDEFHRMAQIADTTRNFTPIWESIVHSNLEYVAKNTIRFTESDDMFCFQYPGSSNNPPNCRYLRFLASGNGTLTVTFDATSSGRNLYVQVAGVSGPAHEAPNTDQDGVVVEKGTFTETVTANAGDEIVLWADASLRVFEISWTPEGYDPDAEIEFDADAINEPYLTEYTDVTKFPTILAGQQKTIDKITYVALDEKDMENDGKRYKFGGKSVVGEDNIPDYGYVSFKITKPGTITHKIISSSGSATNRDVVISLAKDVNGVIDVSEIYRVPAPGSSGADAIETQVTKDHLAGTTKSVTVYIYAPVGAVNIYQLGFTPVE